MAIWFALMFEGFEGGVKREEEIFGDILQV